MPRKQTWKQFKHFMAPDIFSSFDPSIYKIYLISPSLFWIFSFIILTSIMSSFWCLPSLIFFPILGRNKIIHDQAIRTLIHKISPGSLTLISLFLLINLLNLMGLIPYFSAPTCHLTLTLRIGLPIWLLLNLSSFSNNPKFFLTHLLPPGAPTWLNPALTLIETLRIIVRPITLSFRLAANIRAGHIIMGLIGVYLSVNLFSSPLLGGTLFLLQIGYIIFEVGICLIQGYVFSLLISLYADDHST